MFFVSRRACLFLVALSCGGFSSADLRADTTLDSGTTTVSSGTNFGGDLYVGYDATATLEVVSGVAAGSDAWFGYNAGSNGTVTVLGGTWANSGGLNIGFHGNGSLNVNGGRVTDHVTILGYHDDGTGVATLDSGTWNNSGILVVGSYGTGLLSVNGGYLTNAYCWIGERAGSAGTAIVTGGTWVHSDAELYVGWLGSGTLTLSGGSVVARASFIGYGEGSTGMATVSGGTWATTDDFTVGREGTGVLTVNGGLVTVGGTLSTGTAGTINLNAGGTLQIGAGSTGGMLGVPALVNDGTLIFDRADESTYTGIITGSGAVTKQGDGALTLSGSNTYSGTTSVNQGTLLVTDSNALAASPLVVQTGGTLALPSNGRLILSTKSVTVDQATGGTIDIGKGRINIAIGGTTESDLRADLLAGRSGGTWSGTSGIITAGGAVGGAAQPVVGYRVFASGSAVVSWAAFGDANLDGQVNLTDLGLINNGGKFGQGTSTGATWMQGDFNYSGGVTLTDISLLNNAGLFGSGSYLSVASVPEPGTWAIALAGLVCGGFAMGRRRKQARRASSAVIVTPAR